MPLRRNANGARMVTALAESRVTDARASDHRAAVLASFLGWTLDAFDFFLVVFALTAIAKEFHRSDAAIALAITLTLAFRPLGAFIFGLMADRYGRRLPLMIDLVFFSIVEVLSGLAPSYAAFLVLLALFVRVRVKESEVWERTKHESWGQLGRGIASHWKLFLYLTVLRAGMNLA